MDASCYKTPAESPKGVTTPHNQDMADAIERHDSQYKDPNGIQYAKGLDGFIQPKKPFVPHNFQEEVIGRNLAIERNPVIYRSKLIFDRKYIVS